jgi:hypothetical protein
VIAVIVNMKAFADYAAGFYDYGSDGWIWMSETYAAAGEIEGAGHPALVG